MVEPSLDALTAYSSFLSMITLLTLPRCSFSEAAIFCDDEPSSHMRTSPSLPPDSTRLLSLVLATLVTPWLWASVMT